NFRRVRYAYQPLPHYFHLVHFRVMGGISDKCAIDLPVHDLAGDIFCHVGIHGYISFRMAELVCRQYFRESGDGLDSPHRDASFPRTITKILMQIIDARENTVSMLQQFFTVRRQHGAPAGTQEQLRIYFCLPRLRPRGTTGLCIVECCGRPADAARRSDTSASSEILEFHRTPSCWLYCNANSAHYAGGFHRDTMETLCFQWISSADGMR